MKICFRADGGSKIGLGHIMRTMVLAEEFRNRNHDVFYACRVDNPLTGKYEAGINVVLQNGFEVVKLDEDRYIDELKDIKADCIITDSYEADEKYYDHIRENFKVSGCFDDKINCKFFNVDLIINQNSYAINLDYNANPNTLLLLGCKYTLLRKEFRNIRDRVLSEEIKRVMITVGGSDNHNITGKILQQISSIKDIRFDVVIGSAFKYAGGLRSFEGENVKLRYNVKMSELMNKCDVAISACGSTLYELASCGTPAIGIVTAENQEWLAEDMDRLGVIIYSQIPDVAETLMALDKSKRKSMIERGRALVDGLGPQRIADAILSIM